ncbi:MAG: septum formation protein Maf [Clostridia bacterium]|nr:septum formation protein Maf [Clostridia bacterium]
MTPKIILASASPRRRELLGNVVADFTVKVAETDESLDSSIHPLRGVEILSERKGRAVLDELSAEERDSFLIISSDTLVELDGEPLGKPASETEAKEMLRRLSGKRHNVHTGIALHFSGKVFSGVATTGVYFKNLTEDEIEDYIKTGEPMDKAGSYGIQGLGGKFVDKIEGYFDTVVGFSTNLFLKLLAEAGVGFLAERE